MPAVASMSRAARSAITGSVSTASRARDVEHRVHVHARAQQAVLVRDVDEHREHRDVLVDDGLRLDLLDRAPERAARVGGDLDARRHAGGELADVGLVHAHPGAHARQVRHRQEHRAAADVLGRRRDDLAALHEPREDRAVGRRAHLGVLPRDARVLQLDAGGDGLRARVGDLEFEGLEFGLVDPGVARAACRRARAASPPSARRWLAALTSACAWSTRFCGVRGSMRTSSCPAFTPSPVSAPSSRISPEAFDFTSTVATGSITPEASTVTARSPRVTTADS